ncbi:MAG: alpha/beta fold hydrolase [Elusimicrobia bacterium]|nr:alpha/beta fold hydrolase [Elusimicrobiota bacterium]
MRIDSVLLSVQGQKRVGVRYAPDQEGKKRPGLLMLHGFPGAEKNVDVARALVRRGWVCLAPHFRGSWGSHGQYSFSGILQDTAYFWRILNRDPQVKRRSTAVLGFSMGGWAALNFAAQGGRSAKAVVALAPMAGSRQWFGSRSRKKVWDLARTLDIRSKDALWRDFKRTLAVHDPMNVVGKIAAPLLIAHGTQDELVPYELGRGLFVRAGSPKRFVTVRGADHQFSEHREKLIQSVVSFLTETIKS